MIEIIGGGIAGLLAANMLQRNQPIIMERQSQLPHNHSAVLRFKTSTVGDVLGIPFRKVTMIKATASWSNPIADVLAYSYKATGMYRSDRSIIAGTVTDTRYIAPHDLIERMANQLPTNTIHLNERYAFLPSANNPIISTIPMPALMEALGYEPRPDFRYQAGINIHATIEDCDAYVSLMVPDPSNPIARISITGDNVIIECVKWHTELTDQIVVNIAAQLLGIPPAKFLNVTGHQQFFHKITPIDDDARKTFMFWATDHHGIFSLGRYATWRPGLQTDDLIQDVRKIGNWINSRYDMARARH